MSSGTKADVAEVGRALRSGGQYDAEAGANLGLTPRQAELNHYWSYFRCANYEARSVDWSGHQVESHLEREAIASGGFIPPGFYDASGATMPLKYRRPMAPYYLGRVIVNRFTGLLFGASRHPKVMVEGDPDTEDWLDGFVRVTRLWARMTMARTYGGAMGSVGMGFKFVSGRPKIEVHDPRWCTPEFVDRSELIVRQLEKRYMYPATIRDPMTGEYVEAWFWYRRIIDEDRDVVWPKVPVGDGAEPDWEGRYSVQKREVQHGFGFCPVVWIQNNPVQDDIDGDPDCHGIYDTIEAIDCLGSQGIRGTIANCDPTLVISSDGDMDGVAKGSDNAIHLPAGGEANYMEITGAGPKAAREQAAELKDQALEVARCVLDDTGDGQPKTATEIEKRYSSMIEQADQLREQYGEEGVKRLLEMVLRAVRQLGGTKTVTRDDGLPEIVRDVVRLPPRAIEDDAGNVTYEPRKLGFSDYITLKWPPYFRPTLDDTNKAVAAAGAAKQFGLIDSEHATQFVASHFQIEDVQAVLETIEEVTDSAAASLEGQVMGRLMGVAGQANPMKKSG